MQLSPFLIAGSISFCVSVFALFVCLFVNMKFLLEFVTCCGSCDRQPAEETRLLVVQESRRRGGRRKGRARGSSGEWRPSLTSISEEAALMAEKISNVERPVEAWRRKLKRKVSSMSQRDRNRSSDRDYDR
ncbi:hypothetical protein BUALT_Bualt18G0059900 [Buddleja alternifolia]|uniref:Uncharacterized protein n=1 Tax=Buddleja alternifolia TaxID=168488 RepID=A0AAV6W3R0_9LAMI|nr:hypothetical protein BUALT_Bualt18G0059900 [Buddleja alternifolia]